MKTSTASTDGLRITHAQNVSLFSHDRRWRCDVAMARGPKTRPPACNCTCGSGNSGVLRGLDETLLGRAHLSIGREGVDDVDVVGDPAFLGREAVDDAGYDGIGLEFGDRRTLVVV